MTLFVYGSLLFPEVWLAVTRQSCRSSPAVLHEFEARALRGQPYPGLIPCPGSTTEGLAWFDVSPESLARLDSFEGSFYERRRVEIVLPDRSRCAADTYVVGEINRSAVLSEKWDADTFRRQHLPDILLP